MNFYLRVVAWALDRKEEAESQIERLDGGHVDKRRKGAEGYFAAARFIASL